MTTNEFKLRDYQDDCKNVILNDNQNKLICIATGGGKTVIFNNVTIDAVNQGERVLIVVPSIEIISQITENLLYLSPDINISIIQGSNRDTSGDVVIAMRQTLSKDSLLKSGFMDKLLKRGTFKYVVIDEVHQAPNQIRKIYNYNSDSIFLGFTATPYNVRLPEIFTNGIDYDARTSYLMSKNYLCNCDVIRKVTKTNITDISMITGKNKDYLLPELQKKINNHARNELILNSILDIYNKRKSIIVFCAGLEHIESLTELLRANNLNVESITSKTNKKTRKDIISRFKNNEIKILVNCDVLTTGFDSPITDCLVFAVPTKSKTRYMQRLGRGLRIHPDKENCLLIEFVDSNNNLDAVTIQDVLNDDLLSSFDILNKSNDIVATYNHLNEIYSNKEEVYSSISMNYDEYDYNWVKSRVGEILFINHKECLVISKNISNLYNIYLIQKETGSLNYNYPALKIRNINTIEEAKDKLIEYLFNSKFSINLSYLDKNDEDFNDKVKKKINSNIAYIEKAFNSINYVCM